MHVHAAMNVLIHTSGAKSKLPHAIGQYTPERLRELASNPQTAVYCPRNVHPTSRHSRDLGLRKNSTCCPPEVYPTMRHMPGAKLAGRNCMGARSRQLTALD